MTSYLTDKDLQDYGSDVLDLAQRAARHALEPELQRLENQNANLGRQLAVERRRNLYAELDRAMPNWRSIDDDPSWVGWLHGTHNLSGLARQRHLDDAVMRGDANRVIALFRDYLATRGQPAPQSRQPLAAISGRTVYTRPQIAALLCCASQRCVCGP